MLKRSSVALATLLIFTFSSALGQAAMEKFGKNRIQYKTFSWRFYSTDNFNIHFYDGGNELAQFAGRYLEQQFDQLTDLLGYSPYSKTEIYLYNSVADLQQSNVGVNDNSFDVAGQTDFMRAQVEIAYPGTAGEFREELLFNVAKMLITDMMFGGSLSDMFQNSYLLALPEWFIDGAARYAASGWNVEMDNFLRDFILSGKIKNMSKYTGEDAGLLGQSIWNFVAERYGQNYISNILNLTRIIRNEERSIAGTLGLSFKSFMAEWENFYRQQASHVQENYAAAEKQSLLVSKNRDYRYNQVRISPQGNYLAYTRNYNGRYRVIVRQLGSNRERLALRGGYKVINQEYDPELPLLSWRDEASLGIIGTRYGKNFLWMYDVNSKRRSNQEITRINQIRSFDILKNGNLAVISADRDGNSDLYLISLRRNSIKRLTNDAFDDVHPTFIPGTSSILFSSNRTTDSINVKGQAAIADARSYNLFVYNIDTTREQVLRLTNALSNNTRPFAADENLFYFLSDQQGITNLYRYDLSKNMYNQVSNFGLNIKQYDISPQKNALAAIMLGQEKENIYYFENFDFDRNIFTAQTRRQQLLSAKYVAQRLAGLKEKGILPQLAAPPGAEPAITGPAPEVPAGPSFLDRFRRNLPENDPEFVDTDAYVFTPLEDAAQARDTVEQSADAEVVDTGNYVFDTDVVKGREEPGSYLSAYRQLRRNEQMTGPLPYQNRFTADNIVTSFIIDPLIGFGINLETQMNDLLENHKFYGGILASTDLRSGGLYGEYRFLKYTVDFSGRFERKVVYRPTETSSQKYTLNVWQAGASLPLSITTRLTLSPFVASTHFYDLDPRSVLVPGNPPVTSRFYYGGLKAELIYDNSNVLDINLIQGTRGKVGFHMYEALNEGGRSFSNFFLDLRNYQRIHRELIFATRVFYGRFFGEQQQNYLLGGMDNWMFNETKIRGEGDPLFNTVGYDNSNILFAQYVTNLRGFDYNTFFGTNSMLLNAELRFPIIKYFYRGPIASNFFRNFQLVAFYDVGSAWTGSSPFATVNSVNTEILRPPGNPFSAVIQNFKNPWLQSYGFGLRTMLLGYYVKFDMAYPIEDNIRGDARFFVTLGYDF
jgi:hypothetical protein